ncbi:DUF2635 domain-containing protein [Enterobacter cloacae]
MATIKVKAASGLRFPLERDPKRFITSEAVEVESSAYYRRAITDGDLILVTATTTAVDSVAQGEPEAGEAAAPVPAKTTKKASQHE